MNYFDIMIVAIVGIAMLIGFAKGFFKSLSSVFGWLVAIILSILLAKSVASTLGGIPLISKYFFNNPNGFSFANTFYDILPKSLRIDMNTVRSWIVTDGKVVENAPEILIDKIKDSSGVLGIILGVFESSYINTLCTEELLSHNFDNLAQALALLFANSVLVLFTGIILLILFKIISSIILKLFKKSANGKQEGISVISRFFGMILGGVKGIIICAVILGVLSFVINFPFLSAVKEEMYDKESFIAKEFIDTVSEGIDELLSEDNLDKLLNASGYQKTVDLSNLPSVEEPVVE